MNFKYFYPFLLLTCQNIESGYTSLHLAIYKRDLFVVLLLLWHATFSGDEKNNSSGSIVAHPLQLLNSVAMQEHHHNGELYIYTRGCEEITCEGGYIRFCFDSGKEFCFWCV